MIEFDEYKGNKLLVLKKDEADKYGFKFGFKKAQLILTHIEEIKAFVNDQDKARVEKIKKHDDEDFPF